MELNELARKINKMKAAARGRAEGTDDANLRIYVQGFTDALKDVATIIKQARDAERMRQRLANLETKLSQEPELDLSRVPEGGKEAAASGGGAASGQAALKRAAANANGDQEAA